MKIFIAAMVLFCPVVCSAASLNWSIIEITDRADNLLGAPSVSASGTVAYGSNYDVPNSTNEIYYWDGTASQRITFNDQNDYWPSVYDGTVAWTGWDGHDWEIFYWDGETIEQITDNEIDDKFPSLYNGAIAWENWANSDVMYWDGSTIQNITDDDNGNLRPSLYDGTIAWIRSESANPNKRDIMYWDGNEIQQVTDDDAADFGPSLWNGTIAWPRVDVDDNDFEIFFWDGQDIYQITDNDSDDGAGVDLANGIIVWGASSGVPWQGDIDIHYWDGTSIKTLADTDNREVRPSIWASEKKVWVAWQDDNGTYYQHDDIIYLATHIIPEPSSFLLVLISLVTLLIFKRTRKK